MVKVTAGRRVVKASEILELILNQKPVKPNALVAVLEVINVIDEIRNKINRYVRERDQQDRSRSCLTWVSSFCNLIDPFSLNTSRNPYLW